ncbi:hypothetical protein SRHO_G00277140, partial [Serrasalmus rhombeus]
MSSRLPFPSSDSRLIKSRNITNNSQKKVAVKPSTLTNGWARQAVIHVTFFCERRSKTVEERRNLHSRNVSQTRRAMPLDASRS